MRSNAGSDATAELLIYKYTQLNTIRTFSFWITETNHIGCRADLPFTLKKILLKIGKKFRKKFIRATCQWNWCINQVVTVKKKPMWNSCILTVKEPPVFKTLVGSRWHHISSCRVIYQWTRALFVNYKTTSFVAGGTNCGSECVHINIIRRERLRSFVLRRTVVMYPY